MQKFTRIEPGAYEFFHHTPVQIRFNDIDIMGHVNNAVFQYYFDYARLKYFGQVFKNPVSWEATSLILAGICIDYLHTLHLDDEIIVASKVIQLGNKSLQMVQELQKLPEKKTISLNRSVLVAYYAPSGCSVPLPEEWKNDIIAFEKEIGFKHPDPA